MMKLKLENLSPNCNVLHFGDRSILFSYETPVAVWLRDAMHGLPTGLYRTGEYHSRTTAKHINSWKIVVKPWVTIPQPLIETITNGR